MLKELRKELTALEYDAISSVFAIDSRAIDMARSSIKLRHDFLLSKFVALHDEHCPFELHFGRRSNSGRFNFYLGLGAEYYNYESLQNEQDVREIAADLRRFLASTVTCELHESRRGIVKEIYTANQILMDGKPIKFEYHVQMAPFTRRNVRIVNYKAWK